MQKKSFPLSLFKSTARNTKAYKKFLAKHKVKPKSIRSMEDFSRVPVMSKKNYIDEYPMIEKFPDGKIPPMIYASSGSSGKPTFWFRGEEQEESGGIIHADIFENTFGINKKDSTLVIVCFSMGVWVAGNYTLAVCRNIAKKGFNLSVVTPGLEREDFFYCLQKIAPKFDNVILAGYPPFIMDLMVEAKGKGLPIPKRTYAITAGDKFSEQWRMQFLKLINAKNPAGIIGIYGSADAGILGHETAFSVFLRREALKNAKLRQVLFGNEEPQPALVQYDPKNIYFENIGGELVFTTGTAVPLIRYNIRDQGKIFTSQQVKQLIKEAGLSEKVRKHNFKTLNQPMLVKTGRNDVAVTFYALNIYPEHIKAALEDARMVKHFSGNYFASHSYVNNHKAQRLNFEIELNPGKLPTIALRELAKKVFVETLVARSIEYRKLAAVIGSKADPQIILVANGKMSKQHKSGLLSIKGKKPKMVIS